MSASEEQAAAPASYDPTSSKVFLRMKVLEDWIDRLFDTSPLGILRVDMNLGITYANKKAMKICGI